MIKECKIKLYCYIQKNLNFEAKRRVLPACAMLKWKCQLNYVLLSLGGETILQFCPNWADFAVAHWSENEREREREREIVESINDFEIARKQKYYLLQL